MRFLREGAGPGGLPGGERKCHGLCRWVGGPGAEGGGMGWEDPGSRLVSLHTPPSLPSHPLRDWLVGSIWQPPQGRCKESSQEPTKGNVRGPGLAKVLHGEQLNSLFPFCTGGDRGLMR